MLEQHKVQPHTQQYNWTKTLLEDLKNGKFNTSSVMALHETVCHGQHSAVTSVHGAVFCCSVGGLLSGCPWCWFSLGPSLLLGVTVLFAGERNLLIIQSQSAPHFPVLLLSSSWVSTQPCVWSACVFIACLPFLHESLYQKVFSTVFSVVSCQLLSLVSQLPSPLCFAPLLSAVSVAWYIIIHLWEKTLICFTESLPASFSLTTTRSIWKVKHCYAQIIDMLLKMEMLINPPDSRLWEDINESSSDGSQLSFSATMTLGYLVLKQHSSSVSSQSRQTSKIYVNI